MRFIRTPPAIDYGLIWFDDNVSPALPTFLGVARNVARTVPNASDELLKLAGV